MEWLAMESIYRIFVPASETSALNAKNITNVGFDARNYLKIYRNFIWAVRGAGDFSFGEQD